MKKSESQNLRIWDKEVAECFSLWRGEIIARYYEALRYRQQLTPGKPFTYKIADIEANSGLTYKQQLHAKKVLAGSGWLNANIKRFGRGTLVAFELTELARESTKHIKHRHNPSVVKRRLRQSFSRRYTQAFPQA